MFQTKERTVGYDKAAAMFKMKQKESGKVE